jgi:hypothetical protein
MVMDASEVDGQLFLGDNLPPDAAIRHHRGGDEQYVLWGTQAAYEIVKPLNGVIYERVLLLTKDPTTLPHSRAKCAKWVRIGPVKTCVGWTINWQWLYVRAVLLVSTAEPIDVKDIVEDCLREGAIRCDRCNLDGRHCRRRCRRWCDRGLPDAEIGRTVADGVRQPRTLLG